MVTSRELLIAQRKAELVARRERMDFVVRAELEDMSINDDLIDYGETGREIRVNDDRSKVLGWTWRVALRSGAVYTWTMDNYDDAPIWRDGRRIDA